MVCAVLAPIEATALIGVNDNNKPNIFCHADEREQRREEGSSFPGLYNADVKNCFECANRQVTDRTNRVSNNNLTKQCQFSRTLCSFKNKSANRKKRNSMTQLGYYVQKRRFYRPQKTKEKMFFRGLTTTMKPLLKLTSYERNKLRHLKKVGKKRKKRRIRNSHLDKVEIDDDLDMNKVIEKLVKRIALENMKTEEYSAVSPTTEPVGRADVSVGYSQDTTKGIAFPFINNIKQIFRFSNEYFNSRRDSQDKRDITDGSWVAERDSENLKKSTRIRRNVPRHFVSEKLDKKWLRGWRSTINTPNHEVFSAVKRKRRRRKRNHHNHTPGLDSSTEHSLSLFNQLHPNYNESDSTSFQQKPAVRAGLPSFGNTSSSSINHTSNFSITDRESSIHRQDHSSNRTSVLLDDYSNRNVFYHSLENPFRQGYAKRYNIIGHRTSGFPVDPKLLKSERYLKIRHALRNYIQRNNDWTLRKRIMMDRKKRCEGKCNNMPHKCWRSAPLLCIPYIRKGQDELLKYIIKTLQDMLGKPIPRKVDVFDKIKFKPCKNPPKSFEATCEDIMPVCDSEPSTETRPTSALTTTTCAPNTPSTTSSQPPPSPTLPPPLVLYPTTESSSSTMSRPTTNSPSGETVTCSMRPTTCPSSTTTHSPSTTTYPSPTTTYPPSTTTNQPSTTTCSPPTTTYPPSTTTCPPPVTCPPSVTCLQLSPPTTCSPSIPTTWAPASQNNYALLIIGPSTSIIPAAQSFLKDSIVTSSKQHYPNDGTSTELPLLSGVGPLTPTVPPPPTQGPMNLFPIPADYDKNSAGIGLEKSENTPPLSYLQTTELQLNKVTVQTLDQGYTTTSLHVAIDSTQEIQSPATQNTPPWYFSENPVEKSEIFSYTTLEHTPPPVPQIRYKYYHHNPHSSDIQPRYRNQRQMGKQKTYVYKADRPPTQSRSQRMNSRATMPLQSHLSYNYRTKPCRDFREVDYISETTPREEKNLRERHFEKPGRDFRFRDEESLFPGDPFADRYVDTMDKVFPKRMRPMVFRKKFPKYILGRSSRKLMPDYDFDVDEPLSRNYQMYDDKYYSAEMSRRDFNPRLRKNPKWNQRREKREIFYHDSYPWSRNSDNYDNYPDEPNYDDQYPEKLLLPNLDSEKSHWARKREEDQSSSTPGTYALFSELADIATLSPNETEKVSESSNNTTSTEPTNTTVTNPHSSPQNDFVDTFDNEQKSGYDNSQDQNVSILSAGHMTTLKQIPATTSGDTTTTPNPITTTLEDPGTSHELKSNEIQKAQIVNAGKPDKEVGNNHDLDAAEEQIMTTLKTANIVKGPRKLFTKPAPKVYTKVFPDSLPNELETNETPTTSASLKTDKTTVVQTLAAPDVRLQLLAVCEGYLEVVKLIKAQNQTLEEELDSDLSQYCENIISQSFNLPADSVIIKSKKFEMSSPSSATTTAQTAPKNPNKLVAKCRSCDRYRPDRDELSRQNLRAKVVVDILRSPIYKKDLAAYADQNNFYPKGRKTKRMSSSQPLRMDDKKKSTRKYRYKERAKKDFSNSKTALRNSRKKLQRKEGMKKTFTTRRISDEDIELLHLLRQRKRTLLSWLSNPKENQVKPNDLEETEYLDDDEYYTITAETTEDSGTITPKGDQDTSETTTKTTFYARDTIFPVYAKQYGYDRGGELREVEVLWRRVNEDTHEKKIFKNMSVLALLLTSTMAPYVKRKESRVIGGENIYDTEEMSEIQSNSDNKAGFVEPSGQLNEKPVTTSLPPSSPSTTIYFVSLKPEPRKCSTTTTTTTTTVSTTISSTTSSVPTTPTTTTQTTTISKTPSTTEDQTEFESVPSTNCSNQTYIFMRKPDPSTIVGTTPNSTKGHKNSTHRMSRKLEIAKEFFQEYSIEFLNYAVYILPIMFTILFIMCCLCCFLQIINSRGGRRRKKSKKRLMCAEEDSDTTGDSEDETKVRKKKKRKKSLKNDADSENLENRRLRAFWNVLKMNSRGKQRGDVCDEASTPTEKKRSFLQFLKRKKGTVKPEELASLSYPPPIEQDEISDEEARLRREPPDITEDFDSGMKGPVREKKEVDERREIISLLEELKKIELENLEEMKNKKSVCVQYMTQNEQNSVFKRRDIPSSHRYPFNDKKFPFRGDNPSAEELHQDVGEFTELVPYEGDHTERKNESLRRQSDYRGSRCERFFNIFRGSADGMNFTKSGNANKSYIYTKYKNISTDTRDEFMGGTHRIADTDTNLSDHVLDNFPPYSLQRDRQTDIVDEMENLKRQLNKKKNVRLKDNGVLCRL